MSQAMQKGEVTQLLHRWREGDDHAGENLWKTVYADLKRLAGSALSRGRKASGENATSLVHKAYLRLLDAEVDWCDRRHFFLVAARSMRYILADEARRQLATKRGQGAVGSLEDLVAEPVDNSLARPEEVLSVHELLDQLNEARPRQARLVELRYFGGLSVEEAADVLEVTTRTVIRDWRAARDWMHRKMQDRP